MGISRKLAALAAFFVIAAVVAGCGSSVPGNSVASVAGNPITRQAFNHWMYINSKYEVSQAAQQGEALPTLVANDPPQFTSCVKHLRTQIPSLAKTKANTLRKDCQQIFTQYSPTTFLIQTYWYQLDAHKLGITYSHAQLMKQYVTTKQQQWPTTAAWKAFEQASGYTYNDVLFSLYVNALFSKLIKHFEKPVNTAAINAYYAAHKSEFGTPEARDIHLVRTKSQAKAQAALNALKSGQSWNTVAKQYAADASAKANGGLLRGITPGEEEIAVSKQIFGNPPNKLVGPVKGLVDWYVLEVNKVTPATQESLSKATPTIKQILTSQQSQSAQSRLTAYSKKNWFSQTTCRTSYEISECTNYTKPKTTTAQTAPPATSTGTATTGSTTGGK